jgi:hypothetical protein
MNILGFVFALLLIFSFSFAACREKNNNSFRMRDSYLGHQNASRGLVNKAESAIFRELSYKKQPPQEKKTKEKKTKTEVAKKTTRPPRQNLPCARLNLWPLIVEGRSAQPALYDAACRLLSTFYKDLITSDARTFLDCFLQSAKSVLSTKEPLCLEKLKLANADEQLIYYRMLKGTKKWEIGKGYPPLSEYIKVDPNWTEKLCVTHAHPSLLQILFGAKTGKKLYETLHSENAPVLSMELIDSIRGQAHEIASDAGSLYDLLLFGRPTHRSPNKVRLSAEDGASQICLNAQVSLPAARSS